ncbi:MAG: DUF2178 domain-containing protein [Candidatus Eisenbacteria sp.]|nr:DUF2178 domain-containing protein [Candidatus Eisenbacteria bacterium]
MTQARLRNLLALAIWVIVAVGFAMTVFASGGPATYADDSQRRVIGAVFLAIGIFGTPLARLLTRGKAQAGHVHRDERDEWIDAKATSIGMIAVVMLVFLGGIALWEAYQDPGCVPVGWMWVVAYATLILAHLAPAAIALAFDLGVLRRAEG